MEKKRILHYMLGIPPVRGGGLVRYATDLMKAEKEKGLAVLLLIPGKIPKDVHKKIKIKKSASYEGLATYEIENPLPVSMGNGITDIERYTNPADGAIYAEFLKEVKPDLIHVHSFMGLHQEFLTEAKQKDIPVLYTTHDYFGLCPTTNLVYADSYCMDKEWKHCELCCQNAYSDKRLRIEQASLYRFYRKNEWIVDLFHRGILKESLKGARSPKIAEVEAVSGNHEYKDYSKLRDYYYHMFQLIDFFHFNSDVTREVYEFRLGKLNGKVVPISHMGIKDCRKERTYENNKLRLGYFGGWTAAKGFIRLLDVIRDLQCKYEGKIELHVFSETEERQEVFVRNHRNFMPQELPKVMDEIDILVVPSLWKETYGFVVPEAISFGVPVIVSENVGAKVILENNPGIGYSYDGSASQLEHILKELLDNRRLLEDMNRNILQMDFSFSFERHLDNMLQLYENLH